MLVQNMKQTQEKHTHEFGAGPKSPTETLQNFFSSILWRCDLLTGRGALMAVELKLGTHKATIWEKNWGLEQT